MSSPRNYKEYDSFNLHIATFEKVGQWGFPEVAPFCGDFPRELTPYRSKGNEAAACHFFLDDYRFESTWTFPTRSLERLKGFGSVLSPDFSLYTDFPRAVQIFNTYRQRWVARYWQSQGLHVIPTVGWGDETSYDFSFAGLPVGSIVAVSTVGVLKCPKARELFLQGYTEMLEWLQPVGVVAYGVKIDLPQSEIVTWFPPFFEKFNKEV